MIKEQLPESIVDYLKVIELCTEHKKDNERTMASAFQSIGQCNNLMKRNLEAKEAYEKASMVIRELLITKLRQLGKAIDEDTVTEKQLVEPSIFDDEAVKELKDVYQEMLTYAMEAQ